jgi:acyl-coenzyme A synthetase/AMP-(fatty) acid ligase
MILAEQIDWQCQHNASEAALAFGGIGPDTVNYGRLGLYVDNLCRILHRAGVVPGGVYGLLLRNRLVNVVASLALDRLGAVSAGLNEPGQTAALNFAAIITDWDLPSCGAPVWRAGDNWLIRDYDDSPLPMGNRESSPLDLCRIVFTSGSTGAPKPIGLTHAKIAANIAQQDLALGEAFTNTTRRLCCIGISTLFGYLILVRTLASGGLFCFPDPDIPREARRMSIYGIQVLIASPIQLSAFCAHGEQNPGAFALLQLVVTAGSRLPKNLADRVRKFVCPRLINGYGSSEAGVIAAAPVEGLDLERGEVGYVIPGVDVQIVGETSGVPVSGGTGRIRIRGDGVVRAYHGDASGTDAHFDGEWFYPGDLGSLSPDGLLSIAGRQDNVVNLGGIKASLEAIEEKLRAAPAIADVAAIPAPDEAGINRVVALIVPGEAWSEPAFWNYCRANVDRNFWPVRIVLAKDLPHGPSGKIDRRLLPSLV